MALLCTVAVRGQQYAFIRYGTAEGLPEDYVTDVLTDHRGFLWAAAGERGIARFDGKEFHHFGGQNAQINGGVFALATDGDRLIFAGGNAGVRAIQLDAHAADRPDTVFNRLLQRVRGPVRALEFSRDRKLYVETLDGAWQFTIGDSTLVRCSVKARRHAFLQPRLPGVQLRDMAKDCSGQYWLACDSGLVLLTDASRHLFGPEEGLPTRNITSVCLDREGGVWCGSDEGLFHFVPQRFSNIQLGDGIAVSCMIESRNRSMYFGTRGAGVFHYFDGPRRRITVGDGLPSNDISALHELVTGELLIATSSGLVVWGERGVQPVPESLHLPDPRINQIHLANDRTYWFATMNGLVHWDGERSTVFTTRDGLPSNRISCLAEDAFGMMLVGTHDGLARVRATGGGEVASILELGGIHVSSLFVDGKDRLWVGTVGSGVIVRSGGELVRLGRAQGLAGGNIAFIGQDNHGALYFGSNRGVSVLPEENLQCLMPVDTSFNIWSDIPPAQLPLLQAMSMHALTRGMGMQGEAMQDGAVLRDRAGRMWFGSRGGASCYVPFRQASAGRWIPPTCPRRGNERESAPVLRPLLTELCINDTCTDLRGNIVMGRDDHVLRARVILPSFRNPGQVYFLYQLQGMEYTWHRSEDGLILYTGLEPGDYTLVVRATIGEGIWSESEELLHIEVLPPLYQTAWFWIVLLLCAVGAGMLLQRMLSRQRASTV